MKKERKGLGFRRFLSVLLIVTMAFSFLVPASVKVDAAGKKVTVTVGKTVTIKIKKPSKKVKWSVNKPKIAQIVKKTGSKKSTAIIKGKKAGKAVVTAKIGKKKQKVTIIVKNVNVHVHSYTRPATCTQPAQCACGLTYGTALGHQMSPATCQKPQTCIRCSATAGSVVAHNYDRTTSRCIWCNQLNVRDFVGLAIGRTAISGYYNVSEITLLVQNSGLVSFEVLTQRMATVFPSGGGAGIRVYLTDQQGRTYTEQNRFVVLPAGEQLAWFDTLDDATTFTFKPEGVVEFYANYGEHTYLFRVNASKMNPAGDLLYADYTFTQIS